MKESLIEVLSKEKLFPIVRSSNAQEAIDTAKAIIEGGAGIVEINVENPSIYSAIQEISKDAIVCAGGIITSIQAQSAIDCGAEILSSPIFYMNLVKLSKDKHVPYIAGTSTANEAYNGWKARISVVKIYPVTPMGGVLYIKDLLRPMPFLNVIPMGNVKLSEVSQYIKAGAVAVGVGRDLYQGYSFSEITKRTAETLKTLKEQ